MDEILVSKMNSVLDYIGRIAQDSEAFARAELPIVVKELIVYNRTYYTFVEVIGFIIIIIGLFVFKYGFHLFSKKYLIEERKMTISEAESNTTKRIFLMVISFFILLFSTMLISVNFEPFIKSWVSPRIAIIDWVADKVKK